MNQPLDPIYAALHEAANRHTSEPISKEDVLYTLPAAVWKHALTKMLAIHPTENPEGYRLNVRFGWDDERQFDALPDDDTPKNPEGELVGPDGEPWRVIEYTNGYVVGIFPVPDQDAGPILLWWGNPSH